MPDWSYHPAIKQLLFRLPPKSARQVTLASIGQLASLPLGRNIIQLLGHMKPLPCEAIPLLGKTWKSRTGLGGGLTFDRGSIRAFSDFGFSYIEVGPLTVSEVKIATSDIIRDIDGENLIYPNLPENPGLEKGLRELKGSFDTIRDAALHLGVRISHMPSSSFTEALEEYESIACQILPYASFITIDTRWWDTAWSEGQCNAIIQSIQTICNTKNVPLFILIAPDTEATITQRYINLVQQYSLAGIVIGGGIRFQENTSGSQRIYGKQTRQASLNRLRELKAVLSPDKIIIASGGIVEPKDAIEFIRAGASLVQIHSGFVFAGPGFPKRINESLNHAFPQPSQAVSPSAKNFPKSLQFFSTQGWIGFAFVAIILLSVSCIVLYVGLTSVLLPYDKAFLGHNGASVFEIQKYLLKFMSHDRVTLAGTAMSGALLYLSLAIFGIKAKHRWAYDAEKISIGAGFLSFFLYLGFGYFDPLHAVVCLLVLPFFLWGTLKPPAFKPEESANIYNDKAWRNSLTSQLLFVMIGFGLIIAGIVIACVGCSTVFVHEDLMYLHTSHSSLVQLNPKLIPLIAHDRASFGGCLWAVGMAVFFTSLYGYRQGARWVWWALLISGLPGFLCVFGIHFSIGYTHFIHLFPAYIAVIMYVAGLCLSFEFLCLRPRAIQMQ